MENLVDKLQNKYLKIVHSSMEEHFETYVHVGRMEHQENCAAYLVEVFDYAGNYDKVLHQKRDFADVCTANIGYVTVSRAEVITEEEFHAGVIETIINQVKTAPSGEYVYNLSFKGTPDRRALFGYLLKHAKKTGLTL